jgi:hypothetical protein
MRETMGHPQGNQRCRLFQDCFQKFQVIPLWNRGHVMFDCEVNNLLQVFDFLLSNQIREVINNIFGNCLCRSSLTLLIFLMIRSGTK